MECKKVFVRKNKDNKYGFYYCKVDKFIEGYSYDTLKEANEALKKLSAEEFASLIEETRKDSEPVDCAERITFKPYKVEDSNYGVRSCDGIVLSYTKPSEEEIKNMLNDEETLASIKDEYEYKKKVIKREKANGKLKKAVKRIIIIILLFAIGKGIKNKNKKAEDNPTNPTSSSTIAKDNKETIASNHKKLAQSLVGLNLSEDKLEKLVMYMNLSDYANTDASISVENLYTNYTNCIDEILNYDLQNDTKLRLSSAINNTTQKNCLKTIESYRDKIYSTTDESKLISYYSELVNYLKSNNMNEITSSVSIIAINEMYIYANNFFNDEIFTLRDKLIEFTSINKQDVINEGYDILNNKKISEFKYTKSLTKI